MDTNLAFNVMVHTKDSQQKVDEFVKSTIVNFLKAQYKGGNFRNVSVTKNQVQQGSLFYTVFNIEVQECKGYKAFSLVNVVRELFKGSVSTSILIKNLYMDDEA